MLLFPTRQCSPYTSCTCNKASFPQRDLGITHFGSNHQKMAGFPRWGYFSWCARHVFLRLWPKICRLLCSQRIRSCNWTRSWSIVRFVRNLYTVYFAVLDVLILKIGHRPVRQMWFVFLTCRFVWFVPVLLISDHLTFGNVHDASTVRNFNVKRYAVVVLF